MEHTAPNQYRLRYRRTVRDVATFWVKIFPKRFRKSTITLNEKNMSKVAGELDLIGTGSLVDRFVRLNRQMRRENSQEIYELRNKTENKILWSGPFVPFKGTRESFFADKRSYVYNGRKADEQVHLGYDLAQVERSPVGAANSGRVIYADRLRLYGTYVIIDHGYWLQSLYGHLSKILVKVGDAVRERTTDRHQRCHTHGVWRACSLQYDDRRCTGGSQRVVGRALDSRSDSE